MNILGILVMASTAALAETPYSWMQSRQIKSMSEQQIADLKAGRGMGMALAAELNGYPGPSHVLELGDKLQLTTEQRASIEKLFNSMRQEALSLGSKLIAEEAELDKQFAARAVTPQSLKAATTSVAAIQGNLRETHLKYHLSTAQILNIEQMKRYAELRGYSGHHMHRHDR